MELYTTGQAFPSERQRLMERDRVETNLTAAIFNWLSNKGYAVEIQALDAVRADLIATSKEREVIVVETRPFVETLRLPDAMAIAARKPAPPRDRQHRAVVFREGVWMDQATKDLLEQHDIAIWAADPDTGEVRVISAGPIKNLT